MKINSGKTYATSRKHLPELMETASRLPANVDIILEGNIHLYYLISPLRLRNFNL